MIHSGKSQFDFKYDLGGCWSAFIDTPEEAIAYEEEVLKNLFDQSRLAITPSIYYGSWSGREKFFTYQDLIVAEKRPGEDKNGIFRGF